MGATIQATSITTYRRLVTENQNRITASDPWTTTYSYGSWAEHTDSTGCAVVGGNAWSSYVAPDDEYRYRTHYEYRIIVQFAYTTVSALTTAQLRMFATSDGGSSLRVSASRLTESGNPTRIDSASSVKVTTARAEWSEWDVSDIAAAQISGDNYGISLGIGSTTTSRRYYDLTTGASLVTDVPEAPPAPDNAVKVCVDGVWHDGQIAQVFHDGAWYEAIELMEVT